MRQVVPEVTVLAAVVLPVPIQVMGDKEEVLAQEVVVVLA